MSDINGTYIHEPFQLEGTYGFDTKSEKIQTKLSLSSNATNVRNTKSNKQTLDVPFYLRYAGIGFAILSSIVFSLSTVAVKQIQQYHALNLSVWRFQGVLLPSLLMFMYSLIRRNKKMISCLFPFSSSGSKRTWGILLMRGVFGCGAIVFQVLSLQYLNVADSSVICFSTPVFVTFLGHCFLNEKLGFVPVFTSIFTLMGVVIITRPPFLTGTQFDMDTLIGVGMALISMVFAAIIFIILRLLGNVPSSIVMIAFGSIGSLICLVIAFAINCFQLPQGPIDISLAIALGILTYFGQFSLTLSLQYEEASRVALIRTGDVIFAFIWQFIIFGLTPDFFSVIGAVIVISGVIIITARKWVSELEDDNNFKSKCWILLK